MKKLISILLLAISSLDNGSEVVSKDKVKKNENIKVYTELEFREALSKEIELKLKRLKQNEIVEYSKELLKKEYVLKVKEKEFENRELKLKENSYCLRRSC